MTEDNAIVVRGLIKSYKQLLVLDGIDFNVRRGSVMALLGPNGAGKTTTIKILSTLLVPDGGQAMINGYDVVKDANKVRSIIGLTGQYAALDEYLSGEENLQMIGRLYRIGYNDIRNRSRELLELFDLVEAASRPVSTYSGGMRRRLDLAVSLIASPPIIFLDEPTTGLDPRSRLIMWDIIKSLVDSGTTILLTTQDMDEADKLADRIIVLDGGKIIAEGTSDQLKQRVGLERLEITISNSGDLIKSREIFNHEDVYVDSKNKKISLGMKGGVNKLKDVLSRFEMAGIEVENVSFHRPTLDDVFLTLTGHAAVMQAEEVENPVK